MDAFTRGELVRLVRGWTGMKVVDVWIEIGGDEYVSAIYSPEYYREAVKLERFEERVAFCMSHGQVRLARDLVPFDPDGKPPPNMPSTQTLHTNFPQHDFSEGDILMSNTNTLFRFLNDKGEETFCTKLAAASGGRTVVEVKGSGAVVAIETSKLEEVLPFTVGIKYLNGSNTSTTYHFLANEGDFEVKDLLLDEDSGHYAAVTEVNSKSKRATRHFKGWKLNATRVSWAE